MEVETPDSRPSWTTATVGR